MIDRDAKVRASFAPTQSRISYTGNTPDASVSVDDVNPPLELALVDRKKLVGRGQREDGECRRVSISEIRILLSLGLP